MAVLPGYETEQQFQFMALNIGNKKELYTIYLSTVPGTL
jgi:hypothetical protein